MFPPTGRGATRPAQSGRQQLNKYEARSQLPLWFRAYDVDNVKERDVPGRLTFDPLDKQCISLLYPKRPVLPHEILHYAYIFIEQVTVTFDL